MCCAYISIDVCQRNDSALIAIQLMIFLLSLNFHICRHLRDRHCTREGGSYVCRYGYEGVCASLPVDGVSDRDYEAHVVKYHMAEAKEPPEEWSVYMAAQNLPAVLNDPSRGKQSNIFTKKWGDAFVERVNIPPSHVLPDITFNHLDGYIKNICKRFRRHVRLNQNVQTNEFAADFSPTKTAKAAAARPPIAHHETNGHHHVGSSRAAATRGAAYEMSDADLADIPEVFIKPNLDFTKLETFDAIFSDAYEESVQRSGRLLQEKLSHYLDIVEVMIAKQVSRVAIVSDQTNIAVRTIANVGGFPNLRRCRRSRRRFSTQ